MGSGVIGRERPLTLTCWIATIRSNRGAELLQNRGFLALVVHRWVKVYLALLREKWANSCRMEGQERVN